MSKQDSIDKIVEILKRGAIKFHDDFDRNLKYYFIEEKKDDEIIIHFNIKYERNLEFLIILRKQKLQAEYIPNVKGYNKLDLSVNPYRKLQFTEENVILANIYDFIQEINVDEIVCYERFGIILRNPLELSGIYNINIKYITD